MNRATLIALGFLSIGLASTALLIAGPLNPPAGAVAPTYKTLSEVEPRIAVNATNTPGSSFGLYRITQPGSYYLTQNVSIPPDVVWGISIEAAGVTLDLNGYTMNGNGNAVGGIIVSSAGVTIANGSITQTSLSGIASSLFPTGSPGLTVERVRVFNISGDGIPPGGSPGSGVAGIFGGRGAVIRDCYVNNAALGIAAGFNSNVTGCTVEFARQHAFHLQGGATITDCVAVGTGGSLDEGAYFLGAGTTAVNCVARSNTGVGIVTESDCVLTGCSSSNNTGAGIRANSSKLLNCSATFNGGSGIIVEACSVIDSSSEHNQVDGITCGANCLIRGNTCSFNGAPNGIAASIYLYDNNNRIEGNNCTRSNIGIRVSSGGNIITRNTCSANTTNWSIVTGNICLVVQGVAGGAINGNAGGTAPGSTDPSANFTY